MASTHALRSVHWHAHVTHISTDGNCEKEKHYGRLESPIPVCSSLQHILAVDYGRFFMIVVKVEISLCQICLSHAHAQKDGSHQLTRF